MSHILCSFLPSCLSLWCSSLWEHLSESTPFSLKFQILQKAFPSYPSLTNLPSPLFYLIGSGEILIMSYMIYYFYNSISLVSQTEYMLLWKQRWSFPLCIPYNMVQWHHTVNTRWILDSSISISLLEHTKESLAPYFFLALHHMLRT